MLSVQTDPLAWAKLVVSFQESGPRINKSSSVSREVQNLDICGNFPEFKKLTILLKIKSLCTQLNLSEGQI